MSQFGTTKSPPWARPTSEYVTVSAANSIPAGTLNQPQMASTLLTQPGLATNTTIYSLGSAPPSLPQGQYTAQQLAAVGIQPQQAAMPAPTPPVALPQPGIAIPTTLATSQVATISYPAPRMAAPGPANQPQKQRVFTGTITKLHDNFGFVDEDIFFQTSCVKGSVPKMGDRVLVEATYNPNMPFKWNATRIQILPNQGGVSQQAGIMFKVPQSQVNSSSATSSVPTMSISNSLMGGVGPQPLIPTGQTGGGNIRPPGQRRNEMGRFGRDRDRKRDQLERRERPEREERRKRSRSPPKRPAETHPTRPRSPPRRRPRIIPRYVVQVSKLSFDIKESNVIGLKSRYSNMYVPSDFFNANFSWTEAFPLTRPFQIGHHCSFHIMHKDVADPASQTEAVLDAPDADHLFSAKVMLLSCLPLVDFYHKCCALAEDPEDIREGFQHPTRLIQFLVGIKGKNEPMAIGGVWSPSLDGPDPATDPKVLIKTAIRTTRALTGVDLSACTQWYRFAEIRYLRPEETHKGKVLPARVETTVIFLPDVWTCGPTRLEWGGVQSTYRQQLQKRLGALQADGKDETTQEDEDSEEKSARKDPTHYSELDPRTMKIVDLRRELESRTLSSKGLKSQLIARLTKALKTEQEKEEAEEKMETEEEKVKEELESVDTEEKDVDRRKEQEEGKKKEDREKASLERRYSLPENPAIIVHPNPQAKSGKFDCSVMSLSVLLDYRPEDNKEHSFEVSLFAELFNEMLMRDFAFVLYKTLVKAPERKEEEKVKEKDKSKSEEKSSKDKKKKEEKKDSDRKDDKKNRNEEKNHKEREKEKSKKDEDKKGDKGEGDHQEAEEDEEEEDEDGNEDDKGRKDKKKKERKKYQTVEAELLLASVYFDQNHTGYILDKDLEEIIHTIGLQLSRAQVRKIVQKVVSRDSFNYRKLTDRPCDEVVTELEPLDLEKLAQGNAELLRLPSKSGDDTESKTMSGGGEGEITSSLVNYKGSMLDIESVMQRLEKSDKTRQDMETKMKELADKIAVQQKLIDEKEEVGQKIQSELKHVKQQLSVQSKLTSTSENTSKKYLDALTASKEHLSAMVSIVSDVLTDVKKEGKKEKDTKRTDTKKNIKKEVDENGSS
ncbi:hypothetical protein ScPMuIL_003888 [Solemya velum]